MKTKFDLHDLVWFLYRDKAVQSVIFALSLHQKTVTTKDWGVPYFPFRSNDVVYRETYYIEDVGMSGFHADQVFATKQDLLDSL